MTPALGYSEMKDSGTVWLGEIPSDWAISKIGSLYTQRNEKVSDKDYPPLSVTMKGILPQLDTAAKTEDGDNRKLVKIGDFAINSRSDRRGSCGISPYDGSVSLINTILTPRNAMHPGYYNWLFHTSLFADEFYKWGHGIVDDLWTTRWQEMKKIIVPVPSYSIQEQISAYLDTQCAKIDEIIAEAKTSIEDYKKWKASIIYEAVTKGLDPDVEMKETGVSWLGMVPSDWNVTRMKSVFQNVSIKNHPKEEVLSLYRDLGVVPKNSRDDNHNVTSEDTAQYKFVEKGDLVINKMKAWQGSLAVSDYSGIVSPAYYVCRFRSKNIDKRYIHYLLRCNAYAQEFERLSTGMRIGQWDLGIDDFLRVPVLLPDASEQAAIATYLDGQCGKIDELIAEKQSLISDLESYKKSLIYEVVTGKRRVC